MKNMHMLAVGSLALLAALAGCQNVPQDFGGDKAVAFSAKDCPTNGASCRCDKHKCKITVDTSDCSRSGVAKVLAGPVIVDKDNQNARLIWVSNDNQWVFRQDSGILLKSGSTDPSGQFYEKFIAGDDDLPDPSKTIGKKYHWRDVNRTPQGGGRQFDYMVTLYDDASRRCVADPQIFNDG